MALRWVTRSARRITFRSFSSTATHPVLGWQGRDSISGVGNLVAIRLANHLNGCDRVTCRFLPEDDKEEKSKESKTPAKTRAQFVDEADLVTMDLQQLILEKQVIPCPDSEAGFLIPLGSTVKHLFSGTKGMKVTQVLTVNGNRHCFVQPFAKEGERKIPEVVMTGEAELQVLPSENALHAEILKEAANRHSKPKGERGGPCERTIKGESLV
jgi:hypothetical protein